MKKIISLLLVLSLLCILSCSNGNPTTTTAEAIADAPFFAKNSDEMFSDRDIQAEYDASKAVTVQLNGDTVTASSDAVRISGSTVILSQEATYIFSGTLNNGMIVVNAKDTAKIQIVFNGVTITSPTSAALYVLEADKVFLTLSPNTTNSLANGGSFVAIDENNIDAVIFSKQDLTINGAGTLNVSSPVGHGIVCKDDLVITGGTYTVTSASHGLDANDSIRITNASITVNAGKDAIHSDNEEDAEKGFVYIECGTYVLSSAGDGISATSHLQICGGDFSIITGGGSENGEQKTSDNWGDFGGPGGGGRPPMPRSTATVSATADNDSSSSIKGLKADVSILITNGSFVLDCADDAVHTNGSAYIQGGSFSIETGDDAFHADVKLCISGGTVNITESYEGLEALNVEVLGGEIRLVASDDGINAAGGNDASGTGGNRGDDGFGGPGGASNGSIQIAGGSVYIKADGDGIDANGTLSITGGSVTVCGPTSGDTAVLDYDVSAGISNATFIGTGAMQMAQTISSSTQGVLSIRGSGTAGTTITVADADGTVLISTTPEYAYQLIIISSPMIEKGKAYTVTAGTATGEITAK